jgi:hypothetical protein
VLAGAVDGHLRVQRLGRSTRDDLNIALFEHFTRGDKQETSHRRYQEYMKPVPENRTTTSEPAAVVKLHGLSGKLVIGFPIQGD